MTPRSVLVLRPEPGLSRTLAKLEAMGLDAWGEPLFEVGPVPWDAAPLATCDAVLAGSANAFRHGGEGLAALRHLPVHAVGEATAAAARDAGFTAAVTGAGTMQHLLDAPTSAGLHFARLAGRDMTQVKAHAGQAITPVIVYRARRRQTSTAFQTRLQAGNILALLYSARSAQYFARLCDDLGGVREVTAIAALSPAIAQAAGVGWAGVNTAKAPNEPALLALAAKLCQNR